MIAVPDQPSLFCPFIDIPPIRATPTLAVAFTVSITPVQAVTLRTSVILPGQTDGEFESVGAVLDPPLPQTAQSGTDLTSEFFWIPSGAQPGRYIFQFVAVGDGTNTICNVPVDVEDTGGGSDDCVLTSVTDAQDGDTSLDFGTQDLGFTTTRQASLEFSIPVEQATSSGQLFVCQPNNSAVFQLGTGAVVDDRLLVDLNFTPDQPGEISDEIAFYHFSDVVDADPCSPESRAANACIRSVSLVGSGNQPNLLMEFQPESCRIPVEFPVFVLNIGQSTRSGLSIEADFPLDVVPQGDFSVADFTLGPPGSTDPPDSRTVIVRVPETTEPLGSVRLLADSLPVLTRAVPVPACLLIETPEISFGEVTVDSDAPTRFLRIVNPTSQTVNVSASITPANEGFFLPVRSAELSAHALVDLEVGFHPPALGLRNARIEFSSPELPVIPSVILSGDGVTAQLSELDFQIDGADVAPGSTIDLPATAVGAPSSLQFVVSNPSSTALTSVQVQSSDPQFEVSPAGPFDLQAGSSRVYTITFRPRQPGISTGELVVSDAGSAVRGFILRGDASVAGVSLATTDLAASVPPRQMNPYPAVGLQLDSPAAEDLQGILTMNLEYGNLPQDPSVRFLNGGDSIAFEISSGQTRAVFPGEPNPNAARYQTGTVAGAIHFVVSQLKASGGAAVPLAGGPEVGSTEVRYLPPAFIDSLDCARTSAGISLTLKAYSTPRNVTGVDLNLSPAANADLTFAKPPETFANEFFSSWFADANNDRYGGAFLLTLPISISDLRALGGVSMRLRNEVGWSDTVQVQASGCQ